jgi:kynurenine formamidase
LLHVLDPERFEIVDLSQPLGLESPRSKLHGAIDIWTDTLEIPALPAQCRVQVTHINTAVHVGTHFDAPLHFYEGGKAVDQYEPERFVRPTVVIALPHQGGDAVTVRDLQDALPEVRPGDSVFIRFGYASFFQEEAYYDYPALTPEAATYLVSLGIGAYGSDTLSPDPPPQHRSTNFDYPAHQAFLANDVLIVENLGGGLEQVAGERILVVSPPLPLEAADGAMVVPYAFRPR